MKKKLTVIFFIGASFCLNGISHDGGHGPKLGDQPKFGGRVTAVISKDEVKLETKAKLIYKAELTKTNQDIVRVYLYDQEMKPLNLSEFQSAKGELQFKNRKSRKWVTHSFSFKKKDGFFEGNLPTKPKKPFNIDVTFQKKDIKLFAAFDRLS